jgi:hypothetical protein
MATVLSTDEVLKGRHACHPSVLSFAAGFAVLCADCDDTTGDGLTTAGSLPALENCCASTRTRSTESTLSASPLFVKPCFWHTMGTRSTSNAPGTAPMCGL